jgi:hypothetical protein
MISKIRAGILSCIGLMFINLLRGIIMIPSLELENFMIYSLIIQIGFLWFSISLWIVLKYDFIKLNDLEDFKKPLDWLIKNIAIVSGAGIVSTFFPNRDVYLILVLLGLILVINYIIVFVKLYKLDRDDLDFIGDIHNYIIAMIIMFIAYFIVSIINEFAWHNELDFIFHIINAFPIIFLIRYLHREKKDIEKKQRVYSID